MLARVWGRVTNRLQGRLLRGCWGIPGFVGASHAREGLGARDESPAGQAPTGFGGIPGSGFVDACGERVDDGQVFDGLTALEVFGDQVSAT